jgi:translation initiation factor IF-2
LKKPPKEAVVAEVLPESAQGEEAEKKEKAEETEEGKEKETQKEEASPQEASPQQEKAKTPPPKVPQIKIIGKKVVLPEVDDDKEEDESDKKKGKLKRRRPKKERFFPGEDLTKKKSIPISSKDFKEEETTAPEEPSKVYRPISPRRKKQLSLAKAKKTQITTPKAIKRKIKLVDGITVGQLAKRMSVKAGEVIKKLMQLGVMATVNEIIDIDAASLAAHEFDYEIELTT